MIKEIFDFCLSYLVSDYHYDYWHFPHYSSANIDLGDYIINYLPKVSYNGPRDHDGIPLLDLSSVATARGTSVVHSPVLVSQYALGLYSKFLSENNAAILPEFFKMADWLGRDAEVRVQEGEEIACCYMDFGRGPVLSAMAQGQAISVWTRAFQLTKKETYLLRARQAYNLLKMPMECGGVVNAAPGFPVLEEWLDEPFQIFNGHVFAFVGVHEFVQTFAAALKPAELAAANHCCHLYLDASIRLAARIDMRFWTRYSLRDGPIPNIASFFYHHLHVELMKGLYLLTGVADFAYYEKRWRQQMQNPFYKFSAMCLKLVDKAVKFS